ncbi:unnamed protein product [Ceratitis capitata]|uniref:(Mediterranean fruit fly) hypothetical protein n=1 Tax=Ceratitis capitata TaxID=7213 RepID=A0A811V2N8_CERCA|nr:unnamed protein product [Ceratitis capitata]
MFKLYFSLWLVATLVSINAEQNELTVAEICKQVAPSTTILHPNTCDKWVRCPSTFNSEDYEEGSCVYGLRFNKDTGRCESMDDVSCPYESVAVSNRCASMKNGTFLADPNNCSGYIFCNNAREMHSTCPMDLVYHPEKMACVYSNEYSCSMETEVVDVSPICKAVPKNIIFADTMDCTKYYQCDEKEQLNSLTCAEDEAFNYTTFQCVARNKAVCHPLAPQLEPEIDVCTQGNKTIVGYIADKESCSGYYICAEQDTGKPDRHPMYFKCQTGYFFDSNTWSCRDRVNVKCTLDRCEGWSSKYVNVPGDCSAYSRCKNGVTVNTGKCGTGFFFDERSQICSQQPITYAACMP